MVLSWYPPWSNQKVSIFTFIHYMVMVNCNIHDFTKIFFIIDSMHLKDLESTSWYKLTCFWLWDEIILKDILFCMIISNKDNLLLIDKLFRWIQRPIYFAEIFQQIMHTKRGPYQNWKYFSAFVARFMGCLSFFSWLHSDKEVSYLFIYLHADSLGWWETISVWNGDDNGLFRSIGNVTDQFLLTKDCQNLHVDHKRT